MKYRELLPNEIEAYNIGYKNGSRQAVVKVLEFETPEEKKFYRQGYNAGCQDRKRHNVSTKEIESNVSNVSNVKSYDSTIAITNTIVNANVDDNNKGGVGEKGSNKCQQCQQCQQPMLEEVLEYAKGQDEMKGCGGYACSEGDGVRFWLKCQNNHWRENNEYRTPILDWEKALKYRNDKKYLLWVDVDKVAKYWNVLAESYGLGKINSGDITGKKLDNCSKMLVEIICGLIVNPETKELVLDELGKRDYDLWRWAMYWLDRRLCKSKYLRGETEHKNRLDISFLLNENNFKELISPNSEKYIDRE